MHSPREFDTLRKICGENWVPRVLNLRLWILATAIANSLANAQFPPGFNCYKLTNEVSRAECMREVGPSTVTPFPSNFDCSKLTNDDARTSCYGQRGITPAGPAAPTAPVPHASTPQRLRPLRTAPTLLSTGTAFFVSAQGHLLSNAHVVADCDRVVAMHPGGTDTSPVNVIAVDKANDLALMRSRINSTFATFRRGSVALGEGVAVYGFPMAGTLTVSGNLSTGNLSGLAGLGNDPGRYQISAPIQLGNSGGAVLDESGLVIGVVVGKLDAALVQRATGDIPQNINFAIKASIAQNFLEAHNVPFRERMPGNARRVKDIASDAVAFSVLIGCIGDPD